MAAADDKTLDEEIEVEIDNSPEEGAGDGIVAEHEDGSVEVEIDPGTDVEEDPEFYANLAEFLDGSQLSQIATNLIELTDEDRDAHKARVDAYADAIRRTGMSGEAPGGADFEGASKAVLPILQEAAIDFASSAIKELFPIGGLEGGGPVKHQLIGTPTQPKMDKAERKSKLLNWQLTKQMPSFRDDLEVLLTQDAMAGRQYMKMIWDRKRKRPQHLFVRMDEIWLPAEANTFESADRYTHAQSLTDLRFKERVQSKMYRELNTVSPSAPELTSAQEAQDEVAGKQRDSQNKDGTRVIREIYCWLEIEGDKETGGELAPYIVSIEDQSNDVYAIYRNWDLKDPQREALRHIVEFPFIPWDGGPVGLPQLIGGLGIAATGALRALLDAAHIANTQAAVKLEGGGANKGKNIAIVPGQITTIESNVNVDDIRKAVMPIPFPGPNATLYTLLTFCDEKARGVVNVALEKLAESKADMPVGTVLALIEQGSKVYQAIHSRLHRSMERLLEVLHQLNRMYLDEEIIIREAGDLLARRADFDGAMDLAPVTDPNIFSEAQRYAQTQAVAQRATGNPLYDQIEVEKRILKQLRIPDSENLLVKQPEPKRLNPVNENMAMAMGQPVVAFPDQDHGAHLMAHLDFWMSPMYGQNPAIQPTLAPGMVQHLKEHMLYLYVSATLEASNAVVQMDITKLMDDDEEVSKEMDRLIARTSVTFIEESETIFDDFLPPPAPPPMPGDKPQGGGELLAMLGQMMQLVQSLQPPMPMDPSAVQAQEVQRKGAADQAKQQGDAEDRALKREALAIQREKQGVDAMEAQNESMQEVRLAQQAQKTQVGIAREANDSRERMNASDNITALTIADAEMQSGEKVALSTGTGINPDPKG